MQTVNIPEIRRSMDNKDLFNLNGMEEVTGLLLVTVPKLVAEINDI